jgi:hypothetical protein
MASALAATCPRARCVRERTLCLDVLLCLLCRRWLARCHHSRPGSCTSHRLSVCLSVRSRLGRAARGLEPAAGQHKDLLGIHRRPCVPLVPCPCSCCALACSELPRVFASLCCRRARLACVSLANRAGFVDFLSAVFIWKRELTAAEVYSLVVKNTIPSTPSVRSFLLGLALVALACGVWQCCSPFCCGGLIRSCFLGTHVWPVVCLCDPVQNGWLMIRNTANLFSEPCPMHLPAVSPPLCLVRPCLPRSCWTCL